MRTLLMAAPTVVVLAACTAQTSERDAKASLMQTSRAWAEAAAGTDIEKTLAYWADDAVVLAPDQPPIVGKAAIREFVIGMSKIPQFSITWEPESATISASGELGYLLERNRVTFADSTGTLRTELGKAVTIWRRDANGDWKCVVDTWNASPMEPGAAP